MFVIFFILATISSLIVDSDYNQELISFCEHFYSGYIIIWNPLVSTLLVIGLLYLILSLYQELLEQDIELRDLKMQIESQNAKIHYFRDLNTRLFNELQRVRFLLSGFLRQQGG